MQGIFPETQAWNARLILALAFSVARRLARFLPKREANSLRTLHPVIPIPYTRKSSRGTPKMVAIAPFVPCLMRQRGGSKEMQKFRGHVIELLTGGLQLNNAQLCRNSNVVESREDKCMPKFLQVAQANWSDQTSWS